MAADGRVLVVAPAVDEVAATLERAGVTTLVAADPERARSLLDDRQIDCVVTELRFDGDDEIPQKTDPEYPGLALLETIRKRDPTLPVVVYTAADLAGLDPAALAGATACVRRETEGAEATLREWVERCVTARTADRDRLAGVVHDLRNPLRAANVSLARLRENAAPDSDRADNIDDLAAAHGRLGELLDDLDALLAAGCPVLEPQSVALAAVAREAWRAVDTRGATLRVETDATVEADRRRLRRLFENCFVNAVEHGSTTSEEDADRDAADEPDGGERGVTVVVGDSPAGFFVADDGPGIPSEDREAVFERGYSTAGGTGYGLAIVAEIAAAHGWSVAATESESGGARIEFETDPTERRYGAFAELEPIDTGSETDAANDHDEVGGGH